MLTLTFLGVGGAFAKRNFQSNALLEAWSQGPDKQESPDDTLLIDFGTTGPISLHQLRTHPEFAYLDANGIVNYPAIRRVLVTHPHADHIGGLEELALANMFLFGERDAGRAFKPQLISTSSIMVNLWDHSLKGGLSGMPGRYALLQDYFFILSLRESDPERNSFQMLKRYEFALFPTNHIAIQHKYDWPSYGVNITDTKTGESAFYSGDTRFDYPVYSQMMGSARINFHEAQLIEQPDPVHTLLSQLRTLPADVKKKTWLYHYGDDWDSGAYKAVDEEFAGFARQHERYVLFD
ncbi:MAG: MBL fold metallo-hydrolase [Phycisphaerales bacterium]|nr:MBL fold metallo-hydrolase [Phycisphaerales bacterium]